MDKFLGNFKAVADLTEGLDEYFEAMKLPAESREIMRSSMGSIKSGLRKVSEDSYQEYSDYGNGRKEEFVFKLGVPMTAKTLEMETESTFTLNGDRLDGVHKVKGETTISSRFFQGDYLVFEATGNGATMKTFFKKID